MHITSEILRGFEHLQKRKTNKQIKKPATKKYFRYHKFNVNAHFYCLLGQAKIIPQVV